MRITKKLIFTLGVAAASLALGAWWWSNGPGWSGKIAYIDLGKGKEAMVTQLWQGWTDPNKYGITFWYRTDPGEPWAFDTIEVYGQCRWREVELRQSGDSGILAVLRESETVVEYDLRDTIEASGRLNNDLALWVAEDFQPLDSNGIW